MDPTVRAAIAAREMELKKARWAKNPVSFAEEVFGLRTWSRMRDMLCALLPPKPGEKPRKHKRVAIRGGRKISKSTTLSVIGYWWLSCVQHEDDDGAPPQVIILSASGRQISKSIWKEVQRLYHRAAKRGYTLCEEPATLADTGVKFPGGGLMFGFSTDEAEKAASFSGANNLYLVDEASGVKGPIMDAIRGNMAGGGSLVMFSNPTQASGFFYDAFRSDAANWHCLHISSEESPNVTGECDGKIIPGLAGKEWLDEVRKVWRASTYNVHVKGEFPSGDADTVVGPALVKQALDCWSPSQEDDWSDAQRAAEIARLWAEATGPLRIGVDVARQGDDECVIQPARGHRAPAPFVVDGFGAGSRDRAGAVIAGHIIRVARQLRRGQETVEVRVDAIGNGAGVVDALRYIQREANGELNWITVVEVIASESPTDLQYDLLRDELWFAIHSWIEAGGTFAPDAKLEEELNECRFDYSKRTQRLKVESKDELKKRMGRSSDRSDALALAVWDAPSATAAGFERTHGASQLYGEWAPRTGSTGFDDDRREPSTLTGGW